jgi:hypothetical protein
MKPVIQKSDAEIAIDKLITNVGNEAIYNEWNNSTLNNKEKDVQEPKSKDAKRV